MPRGGLAARRPTFAARGARVVASDLSQAVRDLATDEIATVTGDISEEDAARRTVALTLERFGRLDILVNNAERTMNKPLVETSVADWDDVMTVNARANFLHAREALRVMVEHGGGAIVSVASIVSVVAMKDRAAYSGTKGAISQLAKVIAVEYGGRGVRANAVAAGWSKPTPLRASLMTAGRRWSATAALTRSAGSHRRSRSPR